MKNPKNENENFITLKTVMPDKPSFSVLCDSVHLPAKDGMYGVRYSHANAVISLDEGKITAMSNGKVVCEFFAYGGFAKIAKDTLTVITKSIIK